MLLISIDGACRRNGKPDCVASGGVFTQVVSDNQVTLTYTKSVHEYNSTNQRGELLALIAALNHVHAVQQEAQIITDSEYLFNTMTKKWYENWQNKGWVTASGSQVKNKDLWLKVAEAMCGISTELHFYHIKGHCIPFGDVTAGNLLQADDSGRRLLESVVDKYNSVAPTKKEIFENAQKLSKRNNGFELSEEVLRRFITANTVADAIATKAVEEADRKR